MISGPTDSRRTARCWRRSCVTTTPRACPHGSCRRRSCSTPQRMRASRFDLARRLLLSRRDLNELVELLLRQRLADELEVHSFLHEAIDTLDGVGIDQALREVV